MAAIYTPDPHREVSSPRFTAMAKARRLVCMQGEPTDEELMLAYGAGDVTAFQTLYSRHRGPLFRHLQRQLRDAGLAEEFFPDTWQRVITSRDRYRPEAKFWTWFYEIGQNGVTELWGD